MNQCHWDIIDEFTSPSEYQRFCTWIDKQLMEGLIEEVSVQDSYAGQYFEEKWFKCKESSDTWRLVAPQDPFHGYWGPV